MTTLRYQVRIQGRYSQHESYDACETLADARESAESARAEGKQVLGIWRWESSGLWVKIA